MSYILNCENSNIAIEILNELRDQGINARVVPTPSSIINGCGLSLVIKSEADFEKTNKYSDKFIAYQFTKSINRKIEYKKLK
ncbi:MAG: DUF3343 domain-containing protein [Lachnospiraceae bacterium]|nr:DUF3343 domain-containing protein [Lachnospiraceae bacterium]